MTLDRLEDSNIEEGEWARYELKTFSVLIEGTSVDLSGADLRFVILSRPSGSIILSKTTADSVTVVEDEETSEFRRVNVVIGQDDADYDNLPEGVYYWELYDTSSRLKIGKGYATLGHGIQPS